MALKIGDTLRIPFRLFDESDEQDVDTDESNFTWPLSLDGVEVVAPDFTITQPIATSDDLLLNFVLTELGIYTFGALAHATVGYSTDLDHGIFKVQANDEDDIAASLAVPAAAPTNTTFRVGDKLNVVRGDDWDQDFTLYLADGVTPRNLTGSTFIFRVGYRTATSDVALYESDPITPAAPLTGVVSVVVDKADTIDPDIFPISASLWYDLEETDASDVKTRGLGPLEVIRDVGPQP